MCDKRKKGNKTLRKLEMLGIDLAVIPDIIKDSAYEICTGTGFSSTLEIGFLIDEDVSLIKELSQHVPALKVVTSKPELFELRNKKGDEHVGFTHINRFWEDDVFYCVYALPAKYAFENLVKK